ncbi:flagellar basal body P-ring formation chaperone FlgA [Flocculibacter collagenilyticus]|uniref:flagellar basal body P-ring formation chaperone FlgA n=1 Tax=Flocculibacter collagenilyticus TaxID=2744479 RepID=UPI0018F4C0DD|nr:flagellar basal body P-ring formation chaperone FlgA [Flocculibacter collagenilyticus]
MKLLFFISFCMLASWSLHALSFKKPINRLVAPVYVSDIVKTNEINKLDGVLWPASMQGWVSSDDVKAIIGKHSKKIDLTRWQGVKKAWVEWCYPLDISESNKKLNMEVERLLAEKKLKLLNGLRINNSDIPCSKSPTKNTEWISAQLLNHKIIRAKLSTDAQETYVFDLPFEASVQAYMLKSSGNKGSDLSSLNMYLTNVRWTGKEVTDLFDIRNKHLMRNVTAGEVIKISDLAETLAVNAGDKIKVRLMHNSIAIETSGKAITSGRIGETIKVKISNSNKAIDASVIEKGAVNVSV